MSSVSNNLIVHVAISLYICSLQSKPGGQETSVFQSFKHTRGQQPPLTAKTQDRQIILRKCKRSIDFPPRPHERIILKCHLNVNFIDAYFLTEQYLMSAWAEANEGIL